MDFEQLDYNNTALQIYHFSITLPITFTKTILDEDDVEYQMKLADMMVPLGISVPQYVEAIHPTTQSEVDGEVMFILLHLLNVSLISCHTIAS